MDTRWTHSKKNLFPDFCRPLMEGFSSCLGAVSVRCNAILRNVSGRCNQLHKIVALMFEKIVGYCKSLAPTLKSWETNCLEGFTLREIRTLLLLMFIDCTVHRSVCEKAEVSAKGSMSFPWWMGHVYRRDMCLSNSPTFKPQFIFNFEGQGISDYQSRAQRGGTHGLPRTARPQQHVRLYRQDSRRTHYRVQLILMSKSHVTSQLELMEQNPLL